MVGKTSSSHTDIHYHRQRIFRCIRYEMRYCSWFRLVYSIENTTMTRRKRDVVTMQDYQAGAMIDYSNPIVKISTYDAWIGQIVF